LWIYHLWLFFILKNFIERKIRKYSFDKKKLYNDERSYLLKADDIFILHLRPTTPIRNLDQRELKPKSGSCSRTQLGSRARACSMARTRIHSVSRCTEAYWPRGIRTYKPSRVLPIISGPEWNKRRGQCLFSSFEIYACVRRMRASHARAWINNELGELGSGNEISANIRRNLRLQRILKVEIILESTLKTSTSAPGGI